MTNEERRLEQIQSDLDYQTLMMVQQQVEQEQRQGLSMRPGRRNKGGYWNQNCGGFLGAALGVTNLGAVAGGYIFLEVLFLFLWCIDPPYRPFLVGLNCVCTVIFCVSIGIMWLLYNIKNRGTRQISTITKPHDETKRRQERILRTKARQERILKTKAMLGDVFSAYNQFLWKIAGGDDGSILHGFFCVLTIAALMVVPILIVWHFW